MASLKAYLFSLLAILLLHGQAATAAVTSAPYLWGNVNITAGGFMTGIVFHPTAAGVAYMRSDMGGGYRLDPATRHWLPITDHFTNYVELGIESIALDAQDPQRVYFECGTEIASWAPNAFILRSANQGNAWERIALPFRAGGNDNGRSMGERLAVDPLQGGILFLGSRQKGLWKSSDHGSTWSQVTSFPLTDTTGGTWPDMGVVSVLFDPRGGTNGTATQTIYVGAANTTSLYRSTDGGAHWAAVPGQPTGMIPNHAALASNGTLYLTYTNAPGPNGVTDGEVYSLATGTGIWSKITPPKVEGGFAGLAVPPNAPDTVMVTTMDRWWPDDEVYRSVDAGAHWSAIKATSVHDASASPWVRWGAADDSSMDMGNWLGDLKVDPLNPDHVLYLTGASVWGCDDISKVDEGQPTHWTVRAQGIEQTSVIDLASPPAGPVVFSAVGDIGGFVHPDITTSPPAGMLNPIFTTTTSVDFAELSPATMVRVGTGPAIPGCWSTDAGATWSTFATLPEANALKGSVAIAANGNTIIWTPSGKVPYVTADHGTTWTACGSLGASTVVTADRVNPARFYAVQGGTCYSSSDGGLTFTAGAAGLSTNPVRAVPGREGDLWLTGNNGLRHSTDGGATFPLVPSTSQAGAVGFGKSAPGQTHPAIFMVGTVQGTYGVFRSDDVASTWVRINDDQHQWGNIETRIIGDPRTYGRFYLATNGRGIIYGDRLVGGTLALAPTQSVNESAGSVTLLVTRTVGSSGAASVSWSTADGTAEVGMAYTAVSGTLTWTAGDATAKQIVVPIINHQNWGESNQQFAVNLGVETGAVVGNRQTVVTIVNDNPQHAGTLALTADVLSVNQTAGAAQITVSRTGGSDGAVAVTWATANGTAHAGTHYNTSTGSLTWLNGDASNRTISVPIVNDHIAGHPPTAFTVTLASPTGGAAMGTASITVTIIDDLTDAPPPADSGGGSGGGDGGGGSCGFGGLVSLISISLLWLVVRYRSP